MSYLFERVNWWPWSKTVHEHLFDLYWQMIDLAERRHDPVGYRYWMDQVLRLKKEMGE